MLSLLHAGGYAWLLPLLAPPLCMLLAQLARQRRAGLQVSWCQGCWRVGRAAELRPVELSPASTCLPWVIYLAWQERPGGRRCQLWLLADSAPAEQLRQLRVRLRLQR